MWPEVQSEELLPHMYKKGPGRPRKLRITNFGHNVQSCKSEKQDPNALKRKVCCLFVQSCCLISLSKDESDIVCHLDFYRKRSRLMQVT